MMSVIIPAGSLTSRERMIRTTALLVRERGIEATSFSDVIEASGAPRGSIYHHFPGGKSQLIAEATEWSGAAIASGLERALAGGDPVAAMHAFIDVWRGVLTETNFDAGCPVVAASVESAANPGAREAAAAAFIAWEEALAGALEESGAEPDRAGSLATLIVAAIEGAIVQCRALRSLDPLDRVERELATGIAAPTG